MYLRQSTSCVSVRIGTFQACQPIDRLYANFPIIFSAIWTLGNRVQRFRLWHGVGERRAASRSSTRRSDYTPTTYVIVLVRETGYDLRLSRGTNETATLAINTASEVSCFIKNICLDRILCVPGWTLLQI